MATYTMKAIFKGFMVVRKSRDFIKLQRSLLIPLITVLITLC